MYLGIMMKHYYLFFISAVFAWLVLESCSQKKQVPVFTKDIAPIVFRNCSPCHRPGEAGSFSLLSYQDVKKKAKMFAFVTRERIMPPWPADPGYSTFLHQKSLSAEQIDLIQEWVEAGCPEGEAKDLPPVPDFDFEKSQDKPDLIVRMKDKVKIEGNNRDHFFVMKLPIEIPRDTFVSRIEFVPGNRKLIHHMNGHLLLYKANSKRDLNEGDWIVAQDSFDAGTIHEKLKLTQDDGSYPLLIPSVSNYLPGTSPISYPPGIGGYRLTRNSALYLNDVHYGGTPIDQEDSSYFKIFFTDKPPKRPLQEFQMGTLGISKIVPPLVIPPDSIKKFRTDLKVNQDISILTIVPHMHMIGDSYLAYVLKPDGDTIPLIRINKWDFNWQYFYTFPKMVKVPKGSIIHAEAIFDNRSENPNNPFSPPRLLSDKTGSMRTTDEMFQLIVTYLPYQPGDENIELKTAQ